jgi:hypothetical protein
MKFAAETLVLHPDDLPRVREALAVVGCELIIDPTANGDPPTSFGWITGESSFSESEIMDWLQDLVWPAGGDVITAYFGPPQPIRD